VVASVVVASWGCRLVAWVPSLLRGRASASLFVGVVCGRGEMTWPGPPSSVWWCRVSWVGRNGMGWRGLTMTTTTTIRRRPPLLSLVVCSRLRATSPTVCARSFSVWGW
jgi:hypothetical protein